MHKLADHAGKFIGVLFTPAGVDEAIRKHREWACSVARFDGPMTETDVTFQVHTATLRQSYTRGCLELWGMEPDKISDYDGFAFLPRLKDD